MTRSGWWKTALFLVTLVGVIAALGAFAEGLDFAALVKRGWFWAYLGVFAAGVGTSLTPCVYPMIPIVVGIFGAKDASRGAAFGLATLYVTGMGLTFAGLGVAAALAGKATTAVFLADARVVVPLVLLYAALAAAMFGFYELQLPAALQSRLNQVGGRGPLGAFTLGMVGGLTAAPCTGPILLGILGLVAGTGNLSLAFSLLFTYAVGIGVLFWAIAVFAVHLPKSGPWMEGVKSGGGVLLLVAGFYFLRPVWPALVRSARPEIWYVGACLGLAALGVLAGGIHLSFHGSVPMRVRKAVGIVLLVIGLTGGVNWLLTPRAALAWRHDEAAALAEAKAKEAPVLLDFGAEWCAPCKLYETQVFADAAVRAAVGTRFVPLKIDVTEQSAEQVATQKRWGAEVLPTVILLGSDGREVRRFTKPTPTADEFARALHAVP